MTTLAANSPRLKGLGDVNEFPVIASDIIYEGGAVGLVPASGHAQPLTSSDKFVGFALNIADNSGGSAADINVEVDGKGKVQLSVSGAVITDRGQPVYAQDDNAFSFSPVSGVFIGFVNRFISSGVVEVKFDVDGYADPWAGFLAEALAGDKADMDIQDTGKAIFQTTDAKTVTLMTYAAGTALDIVIVNLGAYGTVETKVDPAGGDKISGPNLDGADGGIAVNTKATAQRGDFIHLHSGGDDGYIVRKMRGIWTIA